MLSGEKVSIAEELFEKAFHLQKIGEIEKAIQQYKTSIKFYPTAKAHTYLGWAYSLKGNLIEAIDECRKAIDLDPDYGSPYNDIGVYMLDLGFPDKAISWFQKAVLSYDYEPKHFPYFYLGRIYEKKGEWLEALRYYNKSLILNPEFELAQNAVIKMATLMN